jgi:hypothetical protein
LVACYQATEILHFFRSVAILPSNSQAVSLTNDTVSPSLNHINTAGSKRVGSSGHAMHSTL